ncbi:cadmium/zinc-transporting ATPase HMA3 [Lactuca sativa]|uniref:cadmium/zinc-transporting ATPase HMA3 n=1 Tax=Lactuca sativa TaxID=4236 RepID=UPI001C691F86|nr:cadmium/zinc-transporting ATPase HMA3 [Lactuca sativa]
MKEDSKKHLEKSYFDVLGLCCSSEVSLIEKILTPLEGVHNVSVIVPSRTVIVVHDATLISQFQIVKALNKARLEANVRMKGVQNYGNKWPSPYAVGCGVLLLLSFLKYLYSPFKWLALGAVAVGIIPLTLKAFASLRIFRFDINLLMLIAVGGSIALKDYWEAGTIVFLLIISEWLEARASHKATAVMSSLMSIAPQKAVLADTGEEVNTSEVKVNTRLAVKAGTMIPIDGIVVEGKCEVDEKTLTGESFPVYKQVDSIVFAGTLNLNGYISVKTTAVAEACVVARMARLVEEAQNNKSKTQRYVDEFAKYYTPAVVVVAASLAAIPAAMRVHDLEKWYHLALVVLVSACPCALILSTPIAAFCALSKAATSGLLIKGAEYLEILSTVKFICFDKTGTITRGEFSVSDFRPLIDTDKLLYWVSSIESKSSHPMAASLVDYAQSHSVEPQPDNVEEFKDFPGEGIYGKIDGKDVYIGNQKIGVRAGCSQVPTQINNQGKSTGYVFLGSSLAGIFSLSDSCRIGVKEAIKELKSMGIKTTMLTGDCEEAANFAQNQLGGALDMVHAGLLPQDKATLIKEMQRESPVAMVGDGMNDAPALATADIGISMGVSGSALANDTGHMIMMSNDIRKIPVAVRLAKRTRRKIFENIFIAMVIKAVVIALAIAGHPLVWAAVLADMGTCLVVIFNSMLLLRGVTSRTMKKNSSCLRNDSQCLSNYKVKDKCCEADDCGLEVKKNCCDVGGCNLVVKDGCCDVDSSGLKVGRNCCNIGGCDSQVKERVCDVGGGGFGLEVKDKCCDVSGSFSKIRERLCNVGSYSLEVKDNSCDVGDHRLEVKEKCCDVDGCCTKVKSSSDMGGYGLEVKEKSYDVGAYCLEVKDMCYKMGECGSETKDKCCDIGDCGSAANKKGCDVGDCCSKAKYHFSDVGGSGLEVKKRCGDVGAYYIEVKDNCYDMGGCGSKVKDTCCDVGSYGSKPKATICDVGGCCSQIKDKCFDVGGYGLEVKDKCHDMDDYCLEIKENCCDGGDCQLEVKDECWDVDGNGSKAKEKGCDVGGYCLETKDKCSDMGCCRSKTKGKFHDVGDDYLEVKDNCCKMGNCCLEVKDKSYNVDGFGSKDNEKCCDMGVGYLVSKVKDNCGDMGGGCGSKVKDKCCDLSGNYSKVRENHCNMGSYSLEVKDNVCDVGSHGLEVKDKCCNVDDCCLVVKDNCCEMGGCGLEAKEKCHDVGAYDLEVKNNFYGIVIGGSEVKDKCCDVGGCSSKPNRKRL